LTEKMLNWINVKDYVLDECNDNRIREIQIAFLDNIPTIFYQCLDYGKYYNVGNFNENVDLTVHDSKFKIDDNKIIAYKE
jgi:hypothetical protein